MVSFSNFIVQLVAVYNYNQRINNIDRIIQLVTTRYMTSENQIFCWVSADFCVNSITCGKSCRTTEWTKACKNRITNNSAGAGLLIGADRRDGRSEVETRNAEEYTEYAENKIEPKTSVRAAGRNTCGGDIVAKVFNV